MNYTEQRPWGNFTILDENTGYKVKRIEVLPGQILSYQKHIHRSEHWFIVEGVATITLNDKIFNLNDGESIDIAKEDKHRIHNPSEKETLIFIEIQKGAYLGEDDIIRFSDIYGR